jgi:hypothetical protein
MIQPGVKYLLYSVLIKFGLPMRLARLIKRCLNETYSEVCTSGHLSHSFPIRKGLKQGNVLSLQLFNLALEYAMRKIQETLFLLKLNGTASVIVLIL